MEARCGSGPGPMICAVAGRTGLTTWMLVRGAGGSACARPVGEQGEEQSVSGGCGKHGRMPVRA